jgi:hypothetical protein
MLRRVAPIGIDVSEELGTMLDVSRNRRKLRIKTNYSFHSSDDGYAEFLRNVGSYKSQAQ